MTSLSPTARSTLNRYRQRAATDRQALYDVLDEALICHLGLVLNGSPVVLPTGYGRDGDTLYLHGSTGATSMRAASGGLDACVTVTLLDGIVYARSVDNHSMNYRSAVVHGRVLPVEEREEKLNGLRAITEHLAPGSWEHARGVNAKEFAAVRVLALDLAEASVKIRTGPPSDDPEDLADDTVWAGVLPVHTGFGAPIPDYHVPAGSAVPTHVAGRRIGQSRTGPATGSR